MLRFLSALMLLALPLTAHAACSPSNAPPFSAGCQPIVTTNTTSDTLTLWQPGAFPASANQITPENLQVTGNGVRNGLATWTGYLAGASNPNSIVHGGALTQNGAATFNAYLLNGSTIAGWSPTVGLGLGNAGSQEKVTLDYTTIPGWAQGFEGGSTDARSNMVFTVLTPSGNTSNVYEADNSFMVEQPATGSGGAIAATESGGAITALTLTGGSGYPNGTYNLVFAGGGGSGATGTVTVTGGALATYSITAGGSGYTSAPTVSWSIADVSGERNVMHAYYELDGGITQTTGQGTETYESSSLLNSYIAQYQTFLSQVTLGTNGAANSIFGLHGQLVNHDTNVGSIGEYDLLSLDAESGGGSVPTSYFFARNHDPNAAIATMGNVSITADPTKLVDNGIQLFIKGADQASGTFNTRILDSAGNILWDLANSGDAFLYSSLTIGHAGTAWGKLLFQNITSGSLILVAPSSGALSGVVTLPNATTTLAGLGVAQTWTAVQTVNSGDLKLQEVATASLPTCNAGADGTIAAVNDATSPTYNGTLTGGGAVHVPVFCNGSAWVTH